MAKRDPFFRFYFAFLRGEPALAGSIGVDFEAESKLLGEDAMAHIIQNVDKVLVKLGKQWVSVFDQVNALFAIPNNQTAKNLDGLEYPYNLVDVVQKAGRIISVISASANNELSYRDNHPGFLQFQHPTSMTREELLTAFGNDNAPEPTADANDTYDMEVDESPTEKLTSTQAVMDSSASGGESKTALYGNRVPQRTGASTPLIAQDNVDVVIEHAGGVPLYARLYAQDPDSFQGLVDEEVDKSMNNLFDNCRKRGPRDEWHEDVQVAIFSSLLKITTQKTNYDKNFLLQRVVDGARQLYVYEPLLPAVEIAYRKKLRNGLINYVGEKESTLLNICRDGATSNDTRGRLSQTMAIRRYQASGAEFLVNSDMAKFAAGDIPLLDGRELPPAETHDACSNEA